MDPNEEKTEAQKAAELEAVELEKLKNENPNQQTTAESFKKKTAERKEGRLMTLLSGNTLRVSRPSINLLVKTGQLPSELANSAIKIQSGGAGGLNDQDMKRYVEYNERIVKLAVVSPKIVDEPNYENNEISISDLDDAERSEILTYVNGGLAALAKFRTAGSGATS